MEKLANAIFLKGYQCPFDARKVHNYGSSLIDLIVYQEIVRKKRRVFLDFMRDPKGSGKIEAFSFDLLGREAYQYLKNSRALLVSPIERLKKMNQPAVDLYKDHNIDLEREFLEIAVCAQHSNGGIKGNIWWESNIRHLFPVGEVNGTHGVYRPGGAALNSGQVGSMRAALYISKRYASHVRSQDAFLKSAGEEIEQEFDFARGFIDEEMGSITSLETERREIQERISLCGANIRTPIEVTRAVLDAWKLYSKMRREMKVPSAQDVAFAFRNLDLCLTHALYFEAINEYLERGGRSRGSYLVLDPQGKKPCMELGDEWKFSLNEENSFVDKKILEIYFDDVGNVVKQWVDIRPIPREEIWFENVWNEYLRDNIIE
jgi:hypothetical protein